MSDLKLLWKIEGETQLARRLNVLSAGIKDFNPEFRRSAKFLKGFFGKEVFDSRGRAIGEPWKARKKAYGWPLLERTGKMRRSFREKHSRLSAEVWNAVDYFKFHQSKAPRRKLPRRVMMKLDAQRKNKIVKFFHEGLWKRMHKR